MENVVNAWNAEAVSQSSSCPKCTCRNLVAFSALIRFLASRGFAPRIVFFLRLSVFSFAGKAGFPFFSCFFAFS